MKMDKIRRIGILGTENSHAMAFAKLINLPDSEGNLRFPSLRVTALYAADRTPSEAIAACCGPDIKIFDSPEQMAGEVDCAMVTARHGKYHLPFAMPFIEAGMPVFIDKPFTITETDTRALLAAAKKSGSPLFGGSGCKFAGALLALKDELDANKYGRVRSAVLNFPADLDSEYGGFYFYASHLTEMTTALFGPKVKTVAARQNGGTLLAIASYEGFDVVMNFVKNGAYYAVVYAEKEVVIREIDISAVYLAEAERFAEMVTTGRPPLPYETLTAPVFIMNAIERSLSSGKEEAVNAL